MLCAAYNIFEFLSQIPICCFERKEWYLPIELLHKKRTRPNSQFYQLLRFLAIPSQAKFHCDSILSLFYSLPVTFCQQWCSGGLLFRFQMLSNLIALWIKYNIWVYISKRVSIKQLIFKNLRQKNKQTKKELVTEWEYPCLRPKSWEAASNTRI